MGSVYAYPSCAHCVSISSDVRKSHAITLSHIGEGLRPLRYLRLCLLRYGLHRRLQRVAISSFASCLSA